MGGDPLWVGGREELSGGLAEFEDLRLKGRPLSRIHFRLDVYRSFVCQVMEKIVRLDSFVSTLLITETEMEYVSYRIYTEMIKFLLLDNCFFFHNHSYSYSPRARSNTIYHFLPEDQIDPVMKVLGDVVTFQRLAHSGHEVGGRPGPRREFDFLHAPAGGLAQAEIDAAIVGEEFAPEATEMGNERRSATRLVFTLV